MTLMQPSFSHSKNHLEERMIAGWVLGGDFCPKPLRVVLRAVAIIVSTFFFYLALRTVQLATLGRPQSRKRFCYEVSERWVRAMRGMIGIRVFTIGNIPEQPFFLVINHHTCIGFFGFHSIGRHRIVFLDQNAFMPFTGVLTRGMDLILSDRKRESVPRVTRELIAAIGRKENIVITPEGTISPGHMIRRYHAALLEAAVATGTPVHYATVHWRTPEGSLPPSRAVIYGPDPRIRDASGRLAASELEAWGPERPLLPHLIHLLALPHCDMVIRFGPQPINGKDRVSLARMLHTASLEIFTPSA